MDPTIAFAFDPAPSLSTVPPVGHPDRAEWERFKAQLVADGWCGDCLEADSGRCDAHPCRDDEATP